MIDRTSMPKLVRPGRIIKDFADQCSTVEAAAGAPKSFLTKSFWTTPKKEVLKPHGLYASALTSTYGDSSIAYNGSSPFMNIYVDAHPRDDGSSKLDGTKVWSELDIFLLLQKYMLEHKLIDDLEPKFCFYEVTLDLQNVPIFPFRFIRNVAFPSLVGFERFRDTLNEQTTPVAMKDKIGDESSTENEDEDSHSPAQPSAFQPQLAYFDPTSSMPHLILLTSSLFVYSPCCPL